MGPASGPVANLRAPADGRRKSPQPPARHQDEILLLRPSRLSGEPTCDLKSTIHVVDNWKGGVMLHWEQAAWNADEYACRDPAKLAHEEALILPAANMFEDGV